MKSQNTLILAHLQRGRTITALSALRHYGCLRLASRIAELREDGFAIETTMVERKGKRFASYKMV